MAHQEIHHINGIRMVGLYPTGRRVVAAGSPGFEVIREFERPGYVEFPRGPSRSLAEVWGIEPPRAPFAGKRGNV